MASAPPPADLPIMCTLTATELPDRQRDMAALGREALCDVVVDRTHATLTFTLGGGVRNRIEALVDAERTCCAFLRFAVTEDAGQVRVDVWAPQDAAAVLVEWTRAFAGECPSA